MSRRLFCVRRSAKLTFDGSVGKSRNKKVFGKREKRERKRIKEKVKIRERAISNGQRKERDIKTFLEREEIRMRDRQRIGKSKQID